MERRKEFGRFLRYVFGPLFLGVGLLLWILVPLALGPSIATIRMDIPSRDQVIKISGKFVDSSKGSRRGVGRFPVVIVDSAGKSHRCNCEAGGDASCLSPDRWEHTRLLKQLAGKQGELWMYPATAYFGKSHACYQIADNTTIYRSFDKSVAEYTRAKSGIGVYTVWLWLALIVCVVIVRIAMFTTEDAKP